MKKMIMDFFRDFKEQVDDIKKGNIIKAICKAEKRLSNFELIANHLEKL